MCMDHLVTHQLLTIGALTIMDTIYDKHISISYCRSTSYHVKFWSEPETAGNIEKHERISEPLLDITASWNIYIQYRTWQMYI